jgi:hypothetical protein
MAGVLLQHFRRLSTCCGWQLTKEAVVQTGTVRSFLLEEPEAGDSRVLHCHEEATLDNPMSV